ncbi:hypothetical protein KFL_000200050 [Klebsormidium nitens]|uniref:FAD/NAD(P)-binding domain-containing protein n=1 Tax=Klebsormidium nitens TaxID=105231 RepID=A0A1Y1HLJ5_KLENI|nr:hypothetical protein KFL_000200050 [Klebsormidium nitens]|eukprot:GAQ78853.1 hypothetical protein KFL_000200050 [Klebsormidium nitens]
MTAPRVVIIGGGLGGAAAAKKLESTYDVTLIDEKEFFEYLIGSVRFFVDENAITQGTFLHSEYLKRTKLVVGRAETVAPTHVETDSGERIPFDFLIVSSGSSFAGTPKTLEEKRQWYREQYEGIKAADSVLIAGGGPTGVEIAAEIITSYPDKKLTLVHAGERLVPFMNEKASAKAKDFLVKRGATVLLNDKVNLSNTSTREFRTTSGYAITADYTLAATRARFDSAFMRAHFATALNAEGRVKVEPSLLVEGTRNIFAIGDVTALPEAKQGYYLTAHIATVAANLQTLAKNAAATRLKSYKAQTTTAVALVSLGRKDGIMQTPLLTFSGWVPASLKSKTLFLDKARKDFGLAS